jgi:hypothetical protein
MSSTPFALGFDVFESLARAVRGFGGTSGRIAKASPAPFGMLFRVGAALDLGTRAVMSPRGHFASSMIAGTLANVGAELASFVPIPGVNLALSFLAYGAGQALEKPIQNFVELNHRVRHVDMGGTYQDTQQAYTMRARAAQELGSSLLNARQILGKEALYFHQ